MVEQNTKSDGEIVTVSAQNLKSILLVRQWLNLPSKSQEKLMVGHTTERLSEEVVEQINCAITAALQKGSQVIYRTDKAAHVLDGARKAYFKLPVSANHFFLLIEPQTPKTLNAKLGRIQAKLSLANPFAFFNLQIADHKITKRFLLPDINNYPTIYEIPNTKQAPSIILTPNPYSANIFVPNAA
jgi:hypothetical protein